MPGGKGKIKPADNPKPFTSDHQPDNPGRKPSIRKDFEDFFSQDQDFMTIVGAELLNDKGEPTGEIVSVRTKLVKKDALFLKLSKLIEKGKWDPLKFALEQLIGKAPQAIDVTSGGEQITIPQIILGQKPKK